MALMDDDRPAKKPAHEIGQDLSLISVAELEERITMLKAEVVRLEAAVEARKASRSAADSVFRL